MQQILEIKNESHYSEKNYDIKLDNQNNGTNP